MSQKHISITNIIETTLEEYEKIINSMKKWTEILSDELGVYEKDKNYYEILKTYLPAKDTNVAIKIDNNIKDFFDIKRKLENQDPKTLTHNMSRVLLIENIDKFFKIIKEAYKVLQEITINFELYLKKKEKNKRDNTYMNMLKEYKEDNLKAQKEFQCILNSIRKYKVAKTYKEKLESWFWGFWAKKFRVSFLFLFLIILGWLISLYIIPKESSPDIKFGVINITTIYQWVNPEDIDSLITEKIESEIEDIEGIKKITSSSNIWISSISVELFNDTDTKDALADIQDAVDKANLPSDAEDPSVLEISTRNELMFELLLYGPQDKFSYFQLMQKAQKMKMVLEWKWWISDIDLENGWDSFKFSAGGSIDNDYEIKILLNKEKMEVIWLSIWEVANTIKEFNKNTPIGNYQIGKLKYDFRFEWELENEVELMNLEIRSQNGSNIKLKDIATIEKKYKKDVINNLWFYNHNWLNYITMSFNKAEWDNIFKVSKWAKQAIEKLIKEDEFQWLGYKYSKDMSDIILKDYDNLSQTASQTLIFVFLTLLIFIWFREALIASILLPVSFLITFIILDTLGLTLNFLTNFSLVLTLGIAIDTIIVIIEWWSEKLNMGHNAKSAILIAIRDFKAPLISGTMTTLVAFLPLMFLPWVMGKFLSYIPITVFTTLAAALFLSITISSALFMKIAKNKATYHKDEKYEKNKSTEELTLLEYEREGKKPAKQDSLSIRQKILVGLWEKYRVFLSGVLKFSTVRWITIITPIIALIITFVTISPKIGFVLMPATDKWYINISVTGSKWLDTEYMKPYIEVLDKSFSKYPEMNVYYITTEWNRISGYIELINKNERKDKWMRSVFEIEKLLQKDIEILTTQWLKVEIEILKDGPPTGKPVWIKIVSSSNKKIDILKRVANDFEDYLKTVEWTKNVWTSAEDNPWQFVFQFDKEKLKALWLMPSDILNELYFITNGMSVWTIKSDYEDNDIIVKFKEFDEKLSPSDIENLVINTKIGKIKVWDVAKYIFKEASSTISRIDGNIVISIESDYETGYLPSDLQPKLLAFARSYEYPEGVNFIESGETEENADLIQSVIISFFIAIFLIFTILVLQFNSFGQPLIILYSVILAMLWVNIGLYLTGNTYSMPFAIWFIALTGVVVNDAIIFIDRINKNLSRSLPKLIAIVEAGKTRLQPIIVTTLTTIFGVLPLALQDEFWAGLGFTIIFWLMSGSFMTLFVIPTLYYEKDNIRKLIWWIVKLIFFPIRIIKIIVGKK